MNFNYLKAALWLGVISIVLVILLGAYTFSVQKKIAYVRSADLVNGYLGMKEVQNKYQENVQVWQGNVDTLKFDFQRAIDKYNAEATGLSQNERAEREKYLQQLQQNLTQYSVAIEQKAKEEDEKLTQGVLNQINSQVEAYAQKEGYDIILGTTLVGSLLYAEEGIDITDQLLKELNNAYSDNTQKD